MAWQLVGTYWGPCSCKVSCPCELGEPEGDDGYCAGALAFQFQRGRVDEVDVSGCQVVLVGDWPRGFVSGDGTGRLYFDPSLSPQQRQALEAVLQGKKGGVFEAVAGLIPRFLPSKEASIRIEKGEEETRIQVGDVGLLVTRPLKGAGGQPTRLLHGAFAFRDEVVLARGTGSYWRDPDLRQWESRGHSEMATFDWSA